MREEKKYENGGRVNLADLAKGNEPLLNKVMYVIQTLSFDIFGTYCKANYPDMCMTAEQIHFCCNEYMKIWGLGASLEDIEEILNCHVAGNVISRFDNMGDKPKYRLRLYDPEQMTIYTHLPPIAARNKQ